MFSLFIDNGKPVAVVTEWEAAESYETSVETLAAVCAAGHIRSYRIEGATWYSLSSLKQFFDRCERGEI